MECYVSELLGSGRESVAGQYEEVAYFCLRAEFQFYFSVKIYRQVYFSLCLGYLHSVRI